MQGDTVEQEPILLDASLFMNFVLQYHDEFKGMSLQSSVEYIFDRGKAEVIRSVKTREKTKENKVYGDLGRQYNMTLEQAKAALQEFAQKQAIAIKQGVAEKQKTSH
jgi:hypothetical protein